MAQTHQSDPRPVELGEATLAALTGGGPVGADGTKVRSAPRPIELGDATLAVLAEFGGGGVGLTSDAPLAVGATAGVGTGTAAAREDHVHAHGNQGGGSLHAVATAGAAGFMSSPDKSKLDGVAAGATANSPNATLLNRANHTGTQAWGTITGAPAITALTALAEGSTGGTVVQRTTNGLTRSVAFQADNNHYYFGSGSNFLRFVSETFNFSHAVTGPAFTPSSDLVLKDNVVAVTDDAAALVQVLSAGQIAYDRVQDGVRALGFAAQALNDINPLWVVGGDALPPDGPAQDLDGAVVDEDGVTLRRPLAVDPMAMISSLFAAVRQLANDQGAAEARLERLERSGNGAA